MILSAPALLLFQSYPACHAGTAFMFRGLRTPFGRKKVGLRSTGHMLATEVTAGPGGERDLDLVPFRAMSFGRARTQSGKAGSSDLSAVRHANIMSDSTTTASPSALLPNGPNRRGRKPLDNKTAVVESLFAQVWSKRTQARYIKAWRLCEAAGLDIKVVIPRFTRPNGTIDVSAFVEHAEYMFVVAHCRRTNRRR